MLYTILKSLVLPPGGIILLLLLGFLLVKGVLGRVVIFTGLVLLTLLSLPVVAERLIAGLEPYPALKPAQLSHALADAILILGSERYSWAPEYGGDTIGPRTLERVRYGAFLHRHTGLPVYVTAGSPPEEGTPLGQLMAQVLEQECGIKVAGVEDRSRTTWENAEFSAPMLRRDGVRRVLLVTHAWHMPRALEAFRRTTLQVIPAPTAFVHREDSQGRYTDWLPSPAAFALSYFAIHEYLGQVWYGLKETMEGGPEPSRANI
jgi:uncharacterized SAM-binding protein YcdF (DUF218 family)